MSKLEAMEWIFNYLTDHANGPGVREISVIGDDDGTWRVSVNRGNGESQEGRGADFAEALDRCAGSQVL